MILRQSFIGVLLIIQFLNAAPFDSTKSVKFELHYGHGNYYNALFSGDGLADKEYYHEFLVNVERNLFKEFGVHFLLHAANNQETGRGTCDGEVAYNYDIRSSAYLAALSLHFHWTYFGLNVGVIGMTRDRGFCDSGYFEQLVLPTLDIRMGLMNQLYLIDYVLNSEEYGLIVYL
ncbi:MAG: hypothetical protein GF313_06800 [Caldithrix sp.]|nr:hypothetical protein [Caldithrix sp.]